MDYNRIIINILKNEPLYNKSVTIAFSSSDKINCDIIAGQISSQVNEVISSGLFYESFIKIIINEGKREIIIAKNENKNTTFLNMNDFLEEDVKVENKDIVYMSSDSYSLMKINQEINDTIKRFK